MTPLLTAVINVHTERLMAHKAIRSALAARVVFERKYGEGSMEIVIIADKADDETMKIVNRFATYNDGPAHVYKNFVGDLGLSRNAGVEYAKGKYVAFLDGDDIWGEQWPVLAVAQLERLDIEQPFYKGLCVAHPCLNVDFGAGAFWWSQPDQRQADFDPAIFWNTNCWSSGVCAPRAVLLEHAYRSRGKGLGFEDWEWNARTLANGIVHTSVAGAVVFIRKKEDGLNVQSARLRQLVAHSLYFEQSPEMLPRHKAMGQIFYQPRVSSDSLWKQWSAAHLIEPELRPDVRTMHELPRYAAKLVPTVWTFARAIMNKVAYRPTHVILVPCLVRGGADMRIVHYASAVARAGGTPLIIATDRASDGSWKDRMPEGVNFLDANTEVGDVSSKALAIARLLMRWRSSVHVVNSRVGFMVLSSYGNALKESGCPRAWVSLYGAERRFANGVEALGGASFNGWFWNAHEHVDLVVTDNQRHAGELEQILGWSEDKTRVVNTPTNPLTIDALLAVIEQRKASKLPALRVLWASRMDKGKRLDRLHAIAKLAHERKEPILFAVAGEPGDPWSRRWANELRKLPNVKLSLKAYESWRELVPSKHDVFVFTSESEGMPNVVLEAVGHGLRVVSSDVGRVGAIPYVEIVRDADNPEAWLKQLVTVPEVGAVIKAWEWLKANHSIETFDAALKEAGYFTTPKEPHGSDYRNQASRADAAVEGAPANNAQS